ncbi:MAG: hypothetical protein ACQESR_21820 [Planctomycetota bacterium]
MTSHDLDQLMLNARLRDELEPFLDESLEVVDRQQMSTPSENDYLASILAWERAPVLPISKWFDPELVLPHPDTVDDQQLHELLWRTIHRLHDECVLLELTDHLSDRELYCLLMRDILPAREKKIDVRGNYLQWHCLDKDEDPETWLRYYASPAERQRWLEETGGVLPPAEPPPYPRVMPRRV